MSEPYTVKVLGAPNPQVKRVIDNPTKPFRVQDATDVAIANPSDGQVLIWSGQLGKFTIIPSANITASQAAFDMANASIINSQTAIIIANAASINSNIALSLASNVASQVTSKGNVFRTTIAVGPGLSVNGAQVLTSYGNSTFLIQANAASPGVVGVVSLDDTLTSTDITKAPTANALGALYTFANSVSTFAISTSKTANSTLNLVQSSYNAANAINTYSISAYSHANDAFIIGQTANLIAHQANTLANSLVGIVNYNSATINSVNITVSNLSNNLNSTSGFTQSAFNQANSVGVIAQNAWNSSNAVNKYANSAYGLANTLVTNLNSVNTYAQSAYGAANTVTNTAIAINSYAISAFNVANIALNTAQSAFNVANIALNTAQSAFTTANSNEIVTSFAYEHSNAAFQSSNNVNTYARSGYNLSNTTANLTGIVFSQTNTALTISSNAYNQANISTSLAQAAFNRANVGTVQQTTYIANQGLTVNNNASLTVIGNSTVVLAVNNSSITVPGIVQLNDTVTSTSTSLAATANSVNTVFTATQTAFDTINDVNILTRSAYDAANSAIATTSNVNSFTSGAYTTANNAVTLGETVYAFANTINANVGLNSGAIANVNIFTQSAYDRANSNVQNQITFITNNGILVNGVSQLTVSGNSTIFFTANLATQTGYGTVILNDTTTFPYANQAATANVANTIWTTTVASYKQANTATVLGQSAFDRANIPVSNKFTIQTSGLTVNNQTNLTVTGNTTFTMAVNVGTTNNLGIVRLDDTVINQSNSLAATANAVATVWSTANSAYITANAVNNLASSGYDVANSAYAAAFSSYDQANAVFATSNSINNFAGGAYNQANSALNLAISAYNAANLALAQSANGSNSSTNANISIYAVNLAQAAYDRANVSIQNQITFVTANGITANGGTNTTVVSNNIVILSANSASKTSPGVVTLVDTVASNSISLVPTANVTNTIWSTAFTAINHSNAVNTLTQSAYNLANTVSTTANAAFSFANDVNIFAGGAYSQANNSYAYGQVVFDSSNATNNFAQSAYNLANTVSTEANAVFAAANSINVFAGGAYNQANNALAYGQVVYNFSNNVNQYAQSSYSLANTISVSVNAVNNFAQSGYNLANTVSTKANAAFTNANNALARTGGTMTGNISMSNFGTINFLGVSGNLIFGSTMVGSIPGQDGASLNTANFRVASFNGFGFQHTLSVATSVSNNFVPPTLYSHYYDMRGGDASHMGRLFVNGSGAYLGGAAITYAQANGTITLDTGGWVASMANNITLANGTNFSANDILYDSYRNMYKVTSVDSGTGANTIILYKTPSVYYGATPSSTPNLSVATGNGSGTVTANLNWTKLTTLNLNPSGNVSIPNNLSVQGSITTSNTMSVTGQLSLGSSLSIGTTVGAGGTVSISTPNGSNINLNPQGSGHVKIGSGFGILDAGILNLGGINLPISNGVPTPILYLSGGVNGNITSTSITQWNNIGVSSDTANVTNVLADLAINHNFGGTNFAGSRVGMLVNLQQTGSIAGIPGAYSSVISGIQSSVTLNNSFGGTGTTVNTAAGFATAMNPYMSFGSGFINGGGGSGMEIDIEAKTGSSLMDKVGLLVVQTPNDAVQAIRDEIAISINGNIQSSGKGWKTGISFGRSGGPAGFDPLSTLIGVNNQGSNLNAKHGIDFSIATFSGNTWNDGNVVISGTGTLTTRGRNYGIRTQTTSGNVTISTTDHVVILNKTVGQATSITLPTTPPIGATYIVKDGKGDCNANNITILGNIDNSTNYIMNLPYQSIQVIHNGNNVWYII